MFNLLPKSKTLQSLFSDDFFNLATNLFETDVRYSKNKDGQTILQIDVPGFNKDNLKVEISDGTLTVSGKTDTREVFKQYTLGQITNVNASIKDGILSLTLIEAKKDPTQIQIT